MRREALILGMVLALSGGALTRGRAADTAPAPPPAAQVLVNDDFEAYPLAGPLTHWNVYVDEATR